MIYTYTWNHIRLFAQMCDCEDTKSTVTENWVKMLESQQETMFPFTLWPLTYRTSAVIASTSLLSPSVSTVSSKSNKREGDDECRVILKIYRSNDVIIMCFQHVGSHESACLELCKFNNTDGVKEGHGVHSSDKTHSLVPCGLMNMYLRIKKKAMIELTKFRTPVDSGGVFSCIVCTGYEMGAVLATFMACDLANEFKSEAEFMGLDKPAITVDCVCFSIPKIANDTYWEEFDTLVDKHVSIKHKQETPVDHPRPTIFVGNKDVPLRTKKRLVPCQRYVEEIDKSLRVLG
ncbi:unnamed protein product [Sphacelaria rigidula]